MNLPVQNVSDTIKKIKRKQTVQIRNCEHTIRWVLAHDPPVVWEDASRVFAETVRETTHGDIEIQLLTSQEFIAGRGGETVDRVGLVHCLAKGEIEMAHNYVAALGVVHNRFWALELPFLFRDYDHAEKVLESDIAGFLMEDLTQVGIRGLSFAYSGGFRIIPSAGKKLHCIDDFNGMTIRTSGNPVPAAIFESMGAAALPAPLENIPSLTENGTIDAAEITYVRFMGTGLNKTYNTINETSHSLFMTMIAINDAFFRNLSDAHQVAISAACRLAGRIERQKSIEEEQRVIRNCPAEGIEIVRMSNDCQAEFRDLAMQVYDQFAPTYGEKLIENIRDS